MNRHKLLLLILDNPRNVRFADLTRVVEGFGFRLDRVSGSHHIYKRADVEQLINLQNVGGMAKNYQVKQFLEIVEEYDLRLTDE